MNTRLALLCTIASASVVMAADLPYVGRWKVRLAKSDFGRRPSLLRVCQRANGRQLFSATVPTANPICSRRRPAHTGCKSNVRSRASPEAMDEAREIDAAIWRTKEVLSCRAARIGTPVPG